MGVNVGRLSVKGKVGHLPLGYARYDKHGFADTASILGRNNDA